MKVKRSIKHLFVGFYNTRLLIPFLIIVFVFSIGILVATIEITGQNFFCGNCNEMREHYYTWRVSAHKDTKCKDCHIPPSVINMVKTKVAALREVYVTVTGDKEFEEIEEKVFEVIKSCEGKDGASWDKITKKCVEEGVDRDMIEEALNSLMDKGLIYEPVLGTIKTT